MEPSHRLASIAAPYIRAELPGWGRVMRWSGIRGTPWTTPDVRVTHGKSHGYLMELDLSRWSERYTYFLGRYHEIAVLMLSAKVLRPGDRVVDVGANIGMLTLEFAAIVGAHGVVDAVEPNPECCDRVRRHIELNQIRNVRVHPLGLAETAKWLTLTIPDDDIGKGTFGPVHGGGTRTLTAEVVIGDELIATDPHPPALVKIDVEGYEPLVLRGMDRTLREVKPMLLTEVNSRWLARAGFSVGDLISMLTDHGYLGYTVVVERRGFSRRLRLDVVSRDVTDANAIWANRAHPSFDRLAVLLDRD